MRFKIWDSEKKQMITEETSLIELALEVGLTIPMDVEGIYVGMDGTLVLLDECGNYVYLNSERFKVVTEVREEVEWFSVEMEKTLQRNDHKGGWSTCTLGYLLTRLVEEVRELEEAVARGQFTQEDRERTIRECTDVANYSMMVADLVRKMG